VLPPADSRRDGLRGVVLPPPDVRMRGRRAVLDPTSHTREVAYIMRRIQVRMWLWIPPPTLEKSPKGANNASSAACSIR
jgi:hypothetical protein